ncbi:MAG TPA: hypothetical protein P5040_00245 [Smithella sp.]|nr:hypothetical protein [Smithella sp.]
MARLNLTELRQRVLGGQRGQEAEVRPDGQVVLSADGSQAQVSENQPVQEKQPLQEEQQPRSSMMSHHTWGVR